MDIKTIKRQDFINWLDRQEDILSKEVNRLEHKLLLDKGNDFLLKERNRMNEVENLLEDLNHTASNFKEKK